MKNMICKIVTALLLLFIFLQSYTNQLYGLEVKKLGTSAAAFLRIPVGAKGIAMGSAFTAIADDGSAVFWNPGNITVITQPSFLVHHSPWLPGLQYNYVNCIVPIPRVGVIGINITSLTTEEMDVTTPENPMGTGETFTAGSNAIGFAFARRLTDRFSIGANLKYIQERIYHSTARGFAFDVATMFITPFRDVRLGVNISNIGTNLRMRGEDLNTYVDVAPSQEGNNDNIVSELKTDYYSLPITMRIGLSRDWWLSRDTRFTLACDGVNPSDNAQSLDIGFDFTTFRGLVSLRGGFNELFLKDREKGLTLGAGLKIPATKDFCMTVSYAYQDFKYLGSVNHLTLEITF
ncbi:MAG: PorV/PorQ family protein [Candidatus Marinimicrobia bacterium]|nr:PorV/PorQ family protein [Candidatus Neomarinimicrobiota bacterium]